MSGQADLWADAERAACLFALDPVGFGGVSVRALPGPVREAWLSVVRQALPPSMPMRRVPVYIGDDRLLGGLDLAATLQASRPVAERGLLAEIERGVAVLPMAERWSEAMVARLTGVLDCGEVVIERDGFAARHPARIGVVALDEGVGSDERIPDALRDRLAFGIDLSAISVRDIGSSGHAPDEIEAARARFASVEAGDDTVEALCAAAFALGISSVRASLFALRAARAMAALEGRQSVSEADVVAAGRLVLAPRAETLPPMPAESEDATEDDGPDADPREEDSAAQDDDPPQPGNMEEDLSDLVVAAARSAIPRDLLAQIRQADGGVMRSGNTGKSGADTYTTQRGRPAGVRAGEPRDGARLSIVETLRAASPWQPLRRSVDKDGGDGDDRLSRRRVHVRKDDLRIKRFKKRTETATIFVVDASGSAALQRLGEAKGAVELMLADCYVRRDRVALIAFRGKDADILLAPTRSLARAKRSLVGLPGGGGTPLAAGIEAARALADSARRKGEQPTVVMLTDGRANIALDGTPGREQAKKDSRDAARRLRVDGIAALLIDTSVRPRPESKDLAVEMGALYLALPRADASGISDAVVAATSRAGTRREVAL